jgi:membrane associated rhomboid family serine protease
MSLGEDNNALVALVSINAAGLIILGLIKIIYLTIDSSSANFNIQIIPWFLLPAKLASVAKAPWTLLAYMFIHTRIIAAFTNMLWLWAFGSILQDMAGNKKLIPIYLYGGVAGAVVFIASNYAIPSLRPLINSSFIDGSNAAIMSVAIATTALAPDYRIFRMLNGGIPIWILTILFVVVDFLSVGSGGTAYHLAHIGGGLAGFAFIASLRKGHDGSVWMINFYEWFMNLCNPDKKILTPQKTKEKLFYNTGNKKPFEKRSIVTQQRIDEILDKMNQKGGFRFLSEEEQNILKRANESDLY